ncbi:hypothetical protein, partial [Streptomyces sp. NPDC004285]
MISTIFGDVRQTGRAGVRTTGRRALLVAGAAAGATVKTRARARVVDLQAGDEETLALWQRF